ESAHRNRVRSVAGPVAVGVEREQVHVDVAGASVRPGQGRANDRRAGLLLLALLLLGGYRVILLLALLLRRDGVAAGGARGRADGDADHHRQQREQRQDEQSLVPSHEQSSPRSIELAGPYLRLTSASTRGIGGRRGPCRGLPRRRARD